MQSDSLYTNGVLWVTGGDTYRVFQDPVGGGLYGYRISAQPDVVTIGLTRKCVVKWGEELSAIRLVGAGTRVELDGSIGAAVDGDGEEHDLPSPVAGEVVEVNQEVIEDPEMVVASWHEQGWLVKMRVKSAAALQGLNPYEGYSHRTPFANEQAEREYFLKVMAAQEKKELVHVAIATGLAVRFVVARLIRLGVLKSTT